MAETRRETKRKKYIRKNTIYSSNFFPHDKMMDHITDFEKPYPILMTTTLNRDIACIPRSLEPNQFLFHPYICFPPSLSIKLKYAASLVFIAFLSQVIPKFKENGGNHWVLACAYTTKNYFLFVCIGKNEIR